MSIVNIINVNGGRTELCPRRFQLIFHHHKGHCGPEDGKGDDRPGGWQARQDEQPYNQDSKGGGNRRVPGMPLPPAGGRRQVWSTQDQVLLIEKQEYPSNILHVKRLTTDSDQTAGPTKQSGPTKQ